jgi:hypothetical protein
MTMAREDAVNLLTSTTDLAITERMFGETPWIFERDVGAFNEWRQDVADATACEAEGVYVVGSAMFGYSLSPDKPGRPFRRGGFNQHERSDIDVVIVSGRLFADTWDALLHADKAGLLGGTPAGRDKVRTDLYWGHITNTTVPGGTPPARSLRVAMSATTSRAPFRGHVAKARVYRRREDVVNYHVQSLRELRRTLRVEVAQ